MGRSKNQIQISCNKNKDLTNWLKQESKDYQKKTQRAYLTCWLMNLWKLKRKSLDYV